MIRCAMLTARSEINPAIAGTASTVTVVIPAVLDHIRVNPATTTIEVSKTKEFLATGYDKTLSFKDCKIIFRQAILPDG